jgi:hypothetical protein
VQEKAFQNERISFILFNVVDEAENGLQGVAGAGSSEVSGFAGQ